MTGFEQAVTIPQVLVVFTARSLWVILPGDYLRTPRGRRIRADEPSIDGRLSDGVYHPYSGVWVAADERGWHLRILPSGRPPGSVGITTGTILAIVGQAIAGTS